MSAYGKENTPTIKMKYSCSPNQLAMLAPVYFLAHRMDVWARAQKKKPLVTPKKFLCSLLAKIPNENVLSVVLCADFQLLSSFSH